MIRNYPLISSRYPIPEKIVQQQMNAVAGFQIIIIFVFVFLKLIPVHPGKIKFGTSDIVRAVKYLHFKVDPFPAVHFLKPEIQVSLFFHCKGLGLILWIHNYNIGKFWAGRMLMTIISHHGIQKIKKWAGIFLAAENSFKHNVVV